MSFVEARRLVAGDNPYIGLRPFGTADADLFFGREAQVATLVARLRDTRFVATVGMSGCGKSSLVLAGLIPALELGALAPAGSSWRIAAMRPGTAPIEALATVLARTQVLGEPADDPNAPRALMLAALRSGEQGLVELARSRLRKRENVLVVVDQFEELFRFGGVGDQDARTSEAEAFVALLLAAAAAYDVRLFVAITLRSDFIGDCARFRGLPEAINDSLLLVPRLTRDELQRSIEGPILRQGESIAPALLSRLLDDVGADSDQLPVLEHALMRTWNAWDTDHAAGEPLDTRHYEAIGGMSGALSKHANDLYDALEPRQQPIAERLFRCLTASARDSRGIRRATTFAAVCAITASQPGDIERLFRVYAAPGVSFLNASGPLSNPHSAIDLTHESLTRLWDRLRAWIDDEADSGKTYRKLVDDAALRRAHWIDPELAVGEAWLEKNRASINPAWAVRYDDALVHLPDEDAVRSGAARSRFDAALAFLAASAAAPRRRRTLVVASVGIFFIVAAVLAIAATIEHARAALAQRTAVQAQRSATAAETRAQVRSDEARRARAEANSAALKDHADRVRAAKDLAAARARTADANGQFERARALANYNRAIAVAADDPAAAVAGYGTAIHDLEHGVGTPDDLAFAYYARGAAYVKQHDKTRALADFDEALRRKPDYADAAAAKRTIVDAPHAAHVVQAPRPVTVAAVHEAPTIAPTGRPRPAPLPRSIAASAGTDAPKSGNAAACNRALAQQQRASQTNAAPGAAYDASTMGLADNASCSDPLKRTVNEGYLRSTLAAAEHQLDVGDWRADLNRANDLLARCATMRELRGTPAASDCSAQRKFNDGAAALWSLPSPAASPGRI